ncbi:MAG: A24 family peptidase [Trinickia sp.]|jgi:prepilin peptidase CpaA
MLSIPTIACALLAMLAFSDLRRRRLPNATVAAFAALYFAQAWMVGESRMALLAHVATGVAALVLAALLFRFGWLGGGDAKLFGAVFLWSGPAYASTVFFIVSLFGLILGLAQIVIGRMQRDSEGAGVLGWLAPTRGVPYGIALAAGGVAALWLPLAPSHAFSLHLAAWPLSIHARLT